MSERGGKREGAGRPKGAQNRATVEQKARLSDLARFHCHQAIEVLVEVMQNGKSESAKIAAATAILDRGYGRPPKATLRQMTPVAEDLTADIFPFLG